MHLQVLRQTTLPSVPTRHQTFQRQLSHRLDLDDVPFTVCTLEPKHSLGHIMVSIASSAALSLNSVYRRTISRGRKSAQKAKLHEPISGACAAKSNRSRAALHNYFSRRCMEVLVGESYITSTLVPRRKLCRKIDER